jgi:uncharacterized damage-inducible protein DinB
MTPQDLKLLHDYNTWATQRILTACAQITPDQFNEPANLPYGGLRTTLIHVLEAEKSWRLRCQHQFDFEGLSDSDFPTLVAIQEYWHTENLAWQNYLAGVTESELNEIVSYPAGEDEFRQRVVWHCLVHAINHGSQHRSEAAFLLTNHNASPGDLDVTVFLLEQGYATSTSGD